MTDTLFAAAKLIRELDQSADLLRTQKLLYYVDGSYMAQTGHGLFGVMPQAWTYGPVYKELYDEDKHRHGAAVAGADTSVLTSAQRTLIEDVVDRYRELSGSELIAATHDTQPWIEARDGLADTAPSHRPIDETDMLRFFCQDDNATACPALAQEAESNFPSLDDMRPEMERWAGLLKRLAS